MTAVHLCAPLLAILAAHQLGAETRRAVIVGIDRYHAVNAVPVDTVRRLPVRGVSTRSRWTDLDGAVNDALEMKALLTGRFGFREGDIVYLSNEQATADRILSALQSHLIDGAAPGDIGLFYYAGHGSQIANKLTGERDGLDETIVPADARLGTADIRDKELARIYRAAVRKGVVLTVIQDSCHSGSGARGLWNARGKVRELPRDGRYVEDPPDRDANGAPLPAPEDEGVLVLSASQDDEPAAEVTTDSGTHGLFSFALFHALQTTPPDGRVDRLFQRVRAVMQSEGILQEPVMAGAGRGAKSLLGAAADSANAVTAAVARVDGGKVYLQAGTAFGLYQGCELVRPPLRVRIDRVTGLSSSVASVVEGAAADIQEGDLFRLDRWKAPEYADLRVFIPPALPRAELLAAAAAAHDGASAAGAALVEDPTRDAPRAVMSRQGASWIMEPNPATASPVDLGPHPTAVAIARALSSLQAASLFLLLPPPTGLALPFGPGAAFESIVPESDRAGAHYSLYGRATDRGLSYGWVLPNLTEEEVRLGNPPMALPLRSEWFPADDDAARQLATSAAALARVRAWLRLPSPPADLRFPYRLSFRNIVSGKAIQSGDIVEGERFKLWLEASEPPGGPMERRWVYVFEIDRAGKGTLVFPAKGQGNVSNRLPLTLTGAESAGFPLTSQPWDLEVSAPFGADTLFLLVSAEALPNPEVLDFDAVYSGARGGADDSALGRLLGSVGRGTRGEPAAPLNWFLERQTFRSVPKSK